MNKENEQMEVNTWKETGIFCSTDKSLLDVEMIHRYLANESYWATGRSLEQVLRSVKHSLCFGIYRNEEQLGFARVVTDFTIYAYLMDVFVLESERGKGLGKFLMRCIMSHPELDMIKRWMLGTEDAHGLYKQFGFKELSKVQNHMERVDQKGRE